jgi:hypothetical protein
MKSSILIISTFCFFLISYCQENSSNLNDSTHTFSFILKYGVGAKNVINTFDHTYTKDLISGPDTSILLQLSSQELDTIRLEMERIHILDYPKIFSPLWSDNPNGMERSVNPSSSYYFKIQIGNHIKEITWGDSNESGIKMAINLRGLIFKIIKFVASKEEYKRLPRPRAMYQ